MKFGTLLCVGLLAATAALAGCAPDAPPRIELAEGVVVPDRCGLVFWVDGLDIEHYQRLLAAGKLPNISRYLVERGVTVRGALAALPTITYANNVSFNTGLLPGHHGIVGNKWFDRGSLIYHDYSVIEAYQQVDEDFRATTIYEALSGDLTATILTPVRRGATRNIDNWASAGVAWYFGLHETVNRLTTVRFELIADVANRAGRWPKFIMAYFVTPDTLGHSDGPSSDEYTAMLLDVDRQIGHICQSLAAAGILERTYVTLVSDHGFVDTPQHFPVGDYFRRTLKIPTCDRRYGRNVAYEKRLAHFGKARAVVVTGGDRRCAIHLRAGEQWHERPTGDQIDAFGRPEAEAPRDALSKLLVSHPAVDLAVVRLGPDSVRVMSKSGTGVIDRKLVEDKKKYRYAVLAGADPLGYQACAKTARLMDGQHHSGGAWRWASSETDRPDLIVQLIELNDSPRSGDIALFAADGWDFGHTEPVNRGGHGGLLRHEIIVPWVWAGPDLPAGASISWGRMVDLMPTMLELIGRADRTPGGLDGRSIAPALREAKPTPPAEK